MPRAQRASGAGISDPLARVALGVSRAKYAAQRERFFAALETWDQLGDGRLPISDQHAKEVRAILNESLTILFDAREELGICWMCEEPRPVNRRQYCSDICGRRFRRSRQIQISGRWFPLRVWPD